MPSSISIDNISNNAILLPDFTVHGDFALSFRPDTKGDITSYAAPSGTTQITARCKLQNAMGNDITVINAFVNASATSWQADFVGQSPGVNLQLVPVLMSAGGTVTGTPITGLEIRANGGMTITPVPVPVPEPQPPVPPPIGPDDRKTLKPMGDFLLKATDVEDFRSIIVIDGVEQMDSLLTLAHFRVNNAKRTWYTKKDHVYDKPTGKVASHVVRLKMKNGDVLHVSRAKLSLRSKKKTKKKAK